MHHFFDKLSSKGKKSHQSEASPPRWTPADEESHDRGRYAEATYDEYQEAELFCSRHNVERAKLLPSNMVLRLSQEGCKPWRMTPPTSPRFKGIVEYGTENESLMGVTKVVTGNRCKDVCIFSNLPIMAGLYDINGKRGIYYEVVVRKMGGIIAIGSACLPYPDWRFPGWNRLSAGLHLDDFRKYFEDPSGGRDYKNPGLLPKKVSPGDSIGFGYEFMSNEVFFTYNGVRLKKAFVAYVPREKYDVYAAIGVEGDNDFEVNFGTKVFKWGEGNDWAWRVEGHVGNISGSSGGEDLPSYEASV